MNRTMSRMVDAIHLLALVAWTGVLITAGVAATASFTILPDLELTVRGYEALPDSDHGRIAAGKLMESIFTFVDVIQAMAGSVVVMTGVVQWFTHRHAGRAIRGLRLAAIGIAAIVFVGRATVLTPGMNADLRAYWNAAESGDVAAAAAHRDDFDEVHPVASRLFSSSLLALLVAVVLTPAATRPARETTPGPGGLETPALAERAR